MSKQPAIIVPDGCVRVLLHACCAPCSSAIVEWLLAHDITPVIYYYNPNIYPREEYEIRKNESKRHAESLGILWIDDDRFRNNRLSLSEIRTGASRPCGYEEMHTSWRQAVCGLENEPERGKRCEACFYHRLLATARKAQELGIPYFATTLASSRWKNLEQINAAGDKAAAEINGVHFWAQNWRKEGLQERRNELLKEYRFYNQLYCGCEFSQRSQQTTNN
ncbi:MAG: epoxyqueuosine reductase QueH [Paludibacteraceae bacterium]|nr:epoxyqueuosine reductase QueH [Paludibacteraceae bacterium]